MLLRVYANAIQFATEIYLKSNLHRILLLNTVQIQTLPLSVTKSTVAAPRIAYDCIVL